MSGKRKGAPAASALPTERLRAGRVDGQDTAAGESATTRTEDTPQPVAPAPVQRARKRRPRFVF